LRGSTKPKITAKDLKILNNWIFALLNSNKCTENPKSSRKCEKINWMHAKILNTGSLYY